MIDQDRTADQRSIGRLAAALENAWVRADAGAYASRFARDGTFTNVLGLPAMPDRTVRTRLLMVLVKEDADWWISAYHNVPVVPPPPQT